jgi:hypothetical protein
MTKFIWGYLWGLLLGVILACATAEAASTDTCNDTDTVLMLHMDGADTSTTFTDSATAKSVTAGGNAQIDTAQSKFGGASGLFDGTGDYLQIGSHADFGLPGDFTIDFWMRFSSFTTNNPFIWGTSDTANRFNWHTAGGGRFDIFVGGTIGNSPTFATSTATWYHIAVARSGSTVKVFADGTEVDSWTAAGSISAAAVTLNIYHDLSAQGLNGWMDEFRIVKGTAVWTSGFTPPTAAYSDTCRRRKGSLVS